MGSVLAGFRFHHKSVYVAVDGDVFGQVSMNEIWTVAWFGNGNEDFRWANLTEKYHIESLFNSDFKLWYNFNVLHHKQILIFVGPVWKGILSISVSNSQ